MARSACGARPARRDAAAPADDALAGLLAAAVQRRADEAAIPRPEVGGPVLARLFGKSSAVIRGRRDTKVAAVEALTRMAEAGLEGYRMLTEEEALNVSTHLTAFLSTVTAADRDTLTTAKGMSPRPRATENREDTLLEFLTAHVAQGCGQSFSHDAALWAAQIVARNRGNAALRAAWPGQRARIAAARRRAEDDMRAWYANPGPNQPRTGEQAKYYLAYQRQREKMDKELWDMLRDSLDDRFPHGGLHRVTYERVGMWDLADMVPEAARAQ